jgi:hypothetical protein
VFSTTGEDTGVREVAWLVAGMSGRTGDAGLSTLGLALELEACSGARGALKKKEQISKQNKKNSGNNIRGRKLPRGNRSLPLGLGHADLLPLGCLTWFRLGLNSTLSAGMCAGGGRSLIQRGSVLLGDGARKEAAGVEQYVLVRGE